jgi:predicted transcriptional regulator
VNNETKQLTKCVTFRISEDHRLRLKRVAREKRWTLRAAIEIAIETLEREAAKGTAAA